LFYPLSLACTLAPFFSKCSTMSMRLYPLAKCNGVDKRPAKSRQLTVCGVQSAYKLTFS